VERAHEILYSDGFDFHSLYRFTAQVARIFEKACIGWPFVFQLPEAISSRLSMRETFKGV